MFRLLPLSGCSLGVLVVGLGPALAQVRNMPNATTAAAASQIVLKNLGGETVTRARVRTKRGHAWDMGAGGLTSNQATQVAVPARGVRRQCRGGPGERPHDAGRRPGRLQRDADRGQHRPHLHPAPGGPRRAAARHPR